MKISKNFSLNEFIRSDTALKNKISNVPNKFEEENIKALVLNLMQPLRDYFKKPITILSGFRCEKLNRAIFGAPLSQHIMGEACDFKIKGVNNKVICNYIIKNLEFDQLIAEPTWIHVSYRQKNRMEYFVIK